MKRYAETGQHPGPLPTPGVFARHNAVDTPALLPDGSVSELSVSGTLKARGTVANSRDLVKPVDRTVDAIADEQAPRTTEGRRTDSELGTARRRRAPMRRRRRARKRPERPGEEDPVNPTNYIVLSAILFTIGAVGFMIRRNAIVVFMCVELMLNATNLALVTFSRMHGTLDGQVAAFFVMVVAAAEVVVGLAIIVTIFRTRRSASVDDANLLKF